MYSAWTGSYIHRNKVLCLVCFIMGYHLLLHEASGRDKTKKHRELDQVDNHNAEAIELTSHAAQEKRASELTSHVSTENELVLSALKDPSNLPYNLAGQGPHWSQFGQDKVVDNLLKGKQHGFFIEAGAYNGEDLSNTLFLERSRGWGGLLIEANPHLFSQLQKK